MKRIASALKFRSVITLLLTVSFCLASCSFVNKEKPSIVLGVVLPLSGVFANFGKVSLQGVELAVEEINASGGLLNGRKIELVIEDNVSDPNLSVKKMRRLIQEENALAIVGPVSSLARNAMSGVARQFKRPLLYAIDYEGSHYDTYLFCYSPIPDHVVTPLMSYLTRMGRNRYYILGYDYIWPHNMAKAIRRDAEKFHVDIVSAEFTPFGVEDFSEVLQRVKESGADTLFLVMCGEDGQRVARQFKATGLREKLQLVAIAAEESWTVNLAKDEVEGIVTVSPFVSSKETPETHKFVAKVKKKYGPQTVVTYSTESHYSLVRMFAEAIRKTGSIDNVDSLIQAMEGQRLLTASGEVMMRQDHHVNLNMNIASFQNGELVVREDLGLIVPQDQRPVEQ